MKNSKKGISLIVLVITIIVIIILAAAVLLSINNNNPISNANDATFKSDADSVKSSIALYLGSYMSNSEGVSPFDTSADADDYKIEIGTTNRSTGITDVKPDTAKDSQENVLSWNDLGITKPNTITKAVYDAKTGKLTCTSKSEATFEN